MVKPRYYRKSKVRRYKSKKRLRRYRKRKSKFNTKANAKFIRKVVNKTLHPEKKRYNCLRFGETDKANKDWLNSGNNIIINSRNVNTTNSVPGSIAGDSGARSPFQWYILNPKPPISGYFESTGQVGNTKYIGCEYSNINGANIKLQYIYMKGHIRITKLNSNLAGGGIDSFMGHLRLKLAYSKGFIDLMDYTAFYDNVTDYSAGKNKIDNTTDSRLWKNYHNMTRKQNTYSDVKIKTIKTWKWNRWNKAQTIAPSTITEGSGVLNHWADTGGDDLMIPFSILIRVNRFIMYDKSNSNYYTDRYPNNLCIQYCFESDCGAENDEWAVVMGACGVFTDA